MRRVSGGYIARETTTTFRGGIFASGLEMVELVIPDGTMVEFWDFGGTYRVGRVTGSWRGPDERRYTIETSSHPTASQTTFNADADRVAILDHGRVMERIRAESPSRQVRRAAQRKASKGFR